MKQEEWTNRLREQMADFEEAVPEGLWSDVEAALGIAEKPAVAIAKTGGARLWSLRRWAVAAAVAACMVLGGGYIYNKVYVDGAGKTVVVLRHHVRSGRGVLAQTADAAASSVAESRPSRLQSSAASAIPVAEAVPAASERPREDGGEDVQTPAAEEHPADTQPDTRRQQPANGQPKRAEQPRPAGQRPYGSYEHAARNAASAPRISATLYAQNIASGRASAASQVAMTTSYAVKQAMPGGSGMYSGSNAIPYSTSSYTDRPAPYYLEGYEERVHHEQPITYGLSVAVHLDGRWAVETGLNFTTLNAETVQQMNKTTLSSNQQLGYVGVPLRISYRLWQKGGLQVYGVAGGEADFNVKADYRVEGISTPMEKDKVQLSADAAVGVQYNFVPKVGLYVEPGLKYYFDNGSGIQTIFKEKPANVNLQVGLRWDIR